MSSSTTPRLAGATRELLLAAIEHDLRTPLASLRLRVEMVEEDALRSAIVRLVKEVTAMTDAALRLARHELPDEEEVVRVDIAAIAAAVAEDCRAMGGTVSVAAPAKLLLEGRPQTLRRCLSNLVDNAVRYGGRADIRVFDADGSVGIVVEDDGPGMPPNLVAATILPLDRLDAADRSTAEARGLGLAIVHAFVEMHGGRITLRNMAAGGLRAEILIPKRGIAGGRFAKGEEAPRARLCSDFARHACQTT